MEEKNQNRQVIKNLQAEFERVQKSTKEETLQRLLNEVEKRKEAIAYRTQKTAEKNIRYSEQFSSELLQKAINSNAVNKISINKENGNMSINILNSYVHRLMSVVHNTDINRFYNEKIAHDILLMQAFNEFVQEFARVEKDLILANL